MKISGRVISRPSIFVRNYLTAGSRHFCFAKTVILDMCCAYGTLAFKKSFWFDFTLYFIYNIPIKVYCDYAAVRDDKQLAFKEKKA